MKTLEFSNDDLLIIHRALCKLDDGYTDALLAARSQDSRAMYAQRREQVRAICRQVATAAEFPRPIT